MRPLTAAQSTILALPHAITTKVEIDRTGVGAWVDITNLQGRNWVRTVEVSDDVDSPAASVTVTLQRAQAYFNLSPLMASSLLNVGGVLVTIYRKIRISVSLGPMGTASSDFAYIFKGRIYSIDWASDEIKIECRDHIGDAMDYFIESNSFTYGSDSGVAAETVMQQILDTYMPGSAVGTLYSITGTGGTPFQVADSPGWLIKTYKQDLMPIYAALQVLAQQIGWSLKYRWNASVGDFVLTWYDPERGNTTSLRTFGASQYYSLSECSLHLGDIRNFVRVYYTDVNGRVQNVYSFDSTSISNYGRKFMQIAEEATSQINTSTEAQKMADGACADLALPVMTHSVEMPFFWPVEVGDIYTFSANNHHYDTDQTLAVFSIKHTLTSSKCSTSLSLRGKPSGGVKTWFDREIQQTRKSFGVENLQVTVDDANQCPNGTFVQYSKG